MVDLDRMLELVRALEREGVEYAVFGAVALGLHGLVRATEDVDLFVHATADNVERLKRALHVIWDDPAIEEISARDLAGDYPALRYGPPDERLVIDIVARLGTAFAWEDLEVVTVDVDGEPVRVVSPATLYRMRRCAPRIGWMRKPCGAASTWRTNRWRFKSSGALTICRRWRRYPMGRSAFGSCVHSGRVGHALSPPSTCAACVATTPSRRRTPIARPLFGVAHEDCLASESGAILRWGRLANSVF